MNAKLHSRIESHSGAELKDEVNAHSNSEIGANERDVEIPDRDAHSDFEDQRQSKETRAKAKLAKYVKRHHPAKQIIRDKDVRPMTRKRLRSDTCFLSMKEPKIVKDTLEYDDW